MYPILPAVCHAGLEHRSVGRVALRLHFDRDLSPYDQGIVLCELGAYVLQNKGHAFSPEFQGAIVLLRPPKVPSLDHDDYKAVARHFGYVSPDGDLPFLGPNQCPIMEGTEDQPMHIMAIPRLRQ